MNSKVCVCIAGLIAICAISVNLNFFPSESMEIFDEIAPVSSQKISEDQVISFMRGSSPLSGKLSKLDKRYRTFEQAFKLMEQRQAKVIVETGTARYGIKGCRGDGCSTLLFGAWARAHGAKLFSVDIDPRAIAKAQEAVSSINPEVGFYATDSVSFLEHFNQTIDFLYLDSYDFDNHDPTPSQEHHLKEIIAAYPHLKDHSIVMIDDCDLPHGGKGKLVIKWLQERGWKILKSQYQVLLGKNI